MFAQQLLEALSGIPEGQTRSVSDLAAIAGRPWAAREAGRILARRERTGARHRVVRSDGGLVGGQRQHRRLIAEGARPRSREKIGEWLARANGRFVGVWAKSVYCRPGCAVAERADRARLEALASAREAALRGFRPCTRCAPPVSRLRPPDPLWPGRRSRHCGDRADETMDAQLDRCGHAVLRGVLDVRACEYFGRAAREPVSLRRRVSLERHAFGRGEYGYVAGGPVGVAVDRLRGELYARLLPSARAWQTRLGRSPDLPVTLSGFEAQCGTAGQRLPASTLLRYGPGGWNAPHRDIYGSVVFPFQALIVVSAERYTGGAFALIEAHADEDDLWHLIRPRPGDAVIFPTALRPVPRSGTTGQKGFSPVPVRHALLPIRSGTRTALGLVFHAATK